MNLTQLITYLDDKTGRLDISDAEWLRLLNEASKLLDQLEDSDLRIDRYFTSMTASSYLKALPQDLFTSMFRSVKSVKALTSSAQYDLIRTTPDTIRGYLRDNTTAGEPLYYSFLTGGISTDYLVGQLPATADTLAIQTSPVYRYPYLIVYPKLDQAYTIEIEGLVFTALLQSSTVESNYWTVNYPETLVRAVNYLLVKDLMNIDESTKILQDLSASIRHVSYDLYANEGINQMEG